MGGTSASAAAAMSASPSRSSASAAAGADSCMPAFSATARTCPIHWRTWASGMAPRKPSTSWPPRTATTMGMLCTCNAALSCGLASTSTLARIH